MKDEISLPIKSITLTLIIMVYTICSFVLNKLNFHYIHESGICMILGAITSALAFVFFKHKPESSLINFDEEFFFNLILPPIIFAAGYNLRKRSFFKFFSSSFSFGIIGTFLSFICTFCFLFLLNKINFYSLSFNEDQNYVKFSTLQIILFSAIISASDTVAPLTFIKEEEHPKLFAILFGEGVFNDAMCIVLYRLIIEINKEFNEEQSISTFYIIFSLFYNFCYLFLFSFILGGFGGLLCALLIKLLKKFQPHRTQETMIILLFALTIYSLAEILHLSSILSLLFCGIFMSQYAYLNLSFQAREESCLIAKIFSNFAEAFIFVYLGLSWLTIKVKFISLNLIVSVVLILIISRIISVYFISFLQRLITSKTNLTNEEKIVMVFSGLIRGAISYGLALTIKNSNDVEKNSLLNATIIIVFFTSIFLGGIIPLITKKFLEKLNLQKTNANSDSNMSFSNSLISNDANIESYSFQRYDKKDDDYSENNESFLRRFWKKLDNSYIKPFFIDDWPDVKEDHNIISNKIIEVFDNHQTNKMKNKEMNSIKMKINEIRKNNSINL